ncbi:MAG: integrase family protein [Anaerocolumna sp.]|jgi:integrase/recombinase XerD|nr:integrase family protein [Anaerocolumna sp.]
MNSALQDFLIYLKDVKNASGNTIASYQQDLKRLFGYLEKQNVTDTQKINETILNSYILNMEREGRSPATVSRHLASIKAFILYLIKRGILHEDPTERMHNPKVEKKAPVTLTLDEIKRLFEEPDVSGYKGIRDKAMLELLYATGIRVSELVSLQISDVNIKNKYVTIRNIKNERVIPFGSMAKQALETYLLQARDKFVDKAESDMLFTNLNGEKMSRQGFWKIMKSYGKEAGITKEITPQILRHSFAVHMMENGADLQSVGELLGHIDVTSTQVYMQGRQKKLREVYVEAHPRA